MTKTLKAAFLSYASPALARAEDGESEDGGRRADDRQDGRGEVIGISGNNVQRLTFNA